MREQHMARADGFICVFAMDCPYSLTFCANLHEEIMRVRADMRAGVPIVLCGNKADLDSERLRSVDASEVARRLGVPLFEISAKTRLNIEEAFFFLIREIRRLYPTESVKRKKECSLM